MITQEKLKEYLKYDPNTGDFTWIKKSGSRGVIGRVAGNTYKCNGKKYKRIGILGKIYDSHRLAFMYMKGYFPEEVDHDDGDGTNNKWSNLNESSRSHNMRNLKKNVRNTSGFTGVTLRKRDNKWQAQVQIKGKNHQIGCFDDKIEAANAVKEFREKNGFNKNHGTNRPS